MADSKLLELAFDKKFDDFTKSFKETFSQKFDEKISDYEKEAVREMGCMVKEEISIDISDVITEAVNICSLEQPEDEKSMLIKYDIDGEEKEVVITDKDKLDFYNNLESLEISKLDDDTMNTIKRDVLESCIKRKK